MLERDQKPLFVDNLANMPSEMKNKSRKRFIVAAQYALYLQGRTLDQVAQVYRVTRQSVYDNFRRRGFRLRSKTVLPSVHYRGMKFTVCSSGRDKGYYRATCRHKNIFLHRYVWECEVGTIPCGHGIHHKDGDRSNFKITNLECRPLGELNKLYNPHKNQWTKR